MAKQWYTRISNGSPSNPTDYVPYGDTPPECPGSGKVCAIFAEDGSGNEPLINQNLQDEITNALNSGTESTNVLLRSND